MPFPSCPSCDYIGSCPFEEAGECDGLPPPPPAPPPAARVIRMVDGEGRVWKWDGELSKR